MGQKIISSSNHQTFREEFPLEKQVHEKDATQRYSDGRLIVMVPKK
jgi:HSP20 family molecular chaperone IbpA